MLEEAMTEYPLSPEQNAAMEKASSETMAALADLGTTHLLYEEALAEMKKLKAELERAQKNARHAIAQRDRILAAMASALAMPPGKWVYQNGKLVNEEALHG